VSACASVAVQIAATVRTARLAIFWCLLSAFTCRDGRPWRAFSTPFTLYATPPVRPDATSEATGLRSAFCAKQACQCQGRCVALVVPAMASTAICSGLPVHRGPMSAWIRYNSGWLLRGWRVTMNWQHERRAENG
jgi:hypothetical protein